MRDPEDKLLDELADRDADIFDLKEMIQIRDDTIEELGDRIDVLEGVIRDAWNAV
jgi:hypothetical protein